MPLKLVRITLNYYIKHAVNCYYRYLKGVLPKNNAPTIGVEFATKNVVLRNGGTVKA